jgi:anti-sigma factor RsiW
MDDSARHDAMRMNLGVYALGQLDAAEQQAVLAHLRHCAGCRMELSELDDAADLLRQVKLVRLGIARTGQ